MGSAYHRPPHTRNARATAELSRLRRLRCGCRLSLAQGGRRGNPRDGEMLAEGGVEILGDVGRREAALLEDRGERLGRLEERESVAPATEYLPVHAAGLVRGEEGHHRAVQVRVHL